MMKNQMTRKDIDDQEIYNLTYDSSNIISANTENKEHYLAYEAA